MSHETEVEIRTALEGLKQEIAALKEVGPEEWGLKAAQVGQALEASLANPDLFSLVTQGLVEAASELNCDTVLGASSLGQRLAGAMVALSGGQLKTFQRDIPTGRALIVDGMVSTGTQIVRAARIAKEQGAQEAAAAVVATTNGDFDLRILDGFRVLVDT